MDYLHEHRAIRTFVVFATKKNELPRRRFPFSSYMITNMLKHGYTRSSYRPHHTEGMKYLHLGCDIASSIRCYETVVARLLTRRLSHFVVIVDKVAGIRHLFARSEEIRHMRKVRHKQCLRIRVHTSRRIQRSFHVLHRIRFVHMPSRNREVAQVREELVMARLQGFTATIL